MPKFNTYAISLPALMAEYQNIGVSNPFNPSDGWYYYTDRAGWAAVLTNLLISSSLYQPDKFDCDDYSLKAQVLCAERYGLNALRYTFGIIPAGGHGFCTAWAGSDFIIFEPNEGFNEDVLIELGGEYVPKQVLL